MKIDDSHRVQAIIHHLFISPGHNFFGRHGHPAGTNPTIEVPRVRCRKGSGIEGDRFFDYKPDYRGQITFFDKAVWEKLESELGPLSATPAAVRRNVIVEGLDLVNLRGSRFRLGGVEFEGTTECSPCYWMNDAVAPGAEAWLRGRGGLRAKILSDGELGVGSAEFEFLSGQVLLAV